MWLFYFLAGIVLCQSVISLKGGWRYLVYVRHEMEARRPLYMPFASIIAPCRGLDQGLRANLAALFDQHYPRYEIIFVADSADDPALAIIEEVRRNFDEGQQSAPWSVRIVVAGRARDGGQKVHNLRAGVREVDPASEVLVFVDSDARPRPDWLRSLVAPLEDEGTGATTGYRWFVPVIGNFASQLRAVWNASIASALGARRDRNFCWGGATAIRRSTFTRLNMLDEWRGTLSDDFTLTRVLQRAKLPIHFVPHCLTATREDCNFKELLEFTTRQLKITRVYAPRLWQLVLWSNLLWVMVFYGGFMLTIMRAALGQAWHWPLALITAVYLLGMWKAFFRLCAVAMPLETYHRELRAGAAAHLLAWPLTSLIYVYNALAAWRSRRIVWRGITYELKSPTETVIIAAAPAGAATSSHPRAAESERAQVHEDVL